MAESLTASEWQSPLTPTESLGEGQDRNKMQGHWVLARAGKRVLRPGGLELTRNMLEALAIGPQDRVVEFAPGLGTTAEMVLRKRPSFYWGVEREPAAVELLRHRIVEADTQIVLRPAEDSGLPSGCASVVYSEALLSMQTEQRKNRIVAEANRLLAAGGRYGIHELCLLPDDISGRLRHEIQTAMAKDIHVGVLPLSRNQWIGLLQQNGLNVTWSGRAPMGLLKPGRVLRDEGLLGGLRFAFHATTDRMLRQRIFAMRRLFDKYRDHLGAISLVAQSCRRQA